MSQTNQQHAAPNTAVSLSPSAQANLSNALGRNDPCHCGSGKKYKKCHAAEDEAARFSSLKDAQKNAASQNPMKAFEGMEGFDPSAFDPEAIQKLMSSLQRLPRAQLAMLQSVMQKSMQGQDVTAEAKQLEKMLPPEFRVLAMSMQPEFRNLMQSMIPQGQAGASEKAPTNEEEAKAIVMEAYRSGKLNKEQVTSLLGAAPEEVSPSSISNEENKQTEKKKGLGGLFGLFKKK